MHGQPCNDRFAFVYTWRFSAVVASFITRSCSMLSPVSTGMGDHLRAGIPPWHVTKPTKSTQLFIPLGLLNRVPALIGCSKGGNVTFAGWQVTLCDPIWHVSSRSGEACCKLLYPVTLLTYLLTCCFICYLFDKLLECTLHTFLGLCTRLDEQHVILPRKPKTLVSRDLTALLLVHIKSVSRKHQQLATIILLVERL